MNYALAFLTSRGREREAAQTLASFERAVSPRPSVALCHIDGDAATPPFLYDTDQGWLVSQSQKQEGFCSATGKLWDQAAALWQVDWVFWLEDDFEFVRAVDLIDVAHVMSQEPHVAQMALMRQPCNEDEHRAGGYMQLNPDAYERRGAGAVVWFEHQHHWTTNPSLIRRDVMASHSWLGRYEDYCEGRFGIQLLRDRPGTTYGIWGAGDQPWVNHFGVRQGKGY